MLHMTDPTFSPGEHIPEWTLGWRLKRSLDWAGMSAAEMAEELEVHPGTISRFMNDRETPRRAYLRVWALRCGVPFDWLSGTEALTSADSGHQSSNLRRESAQLISTAELPSLMKRIPLTRTTRESHIQAATR